MTRKRERRLRTGLWLLIMASACVIAWTAWPSPWGHIAAPAVAAAAILIGHRVMIGPRGVAVLTYHSVSPDPAWLPWSREIAIHPDSFAAHLTTLRTMGCSVIGTRDYVDRRRSGRSLPADAVLLHFDDGYLDNWLHAVPRLAEHGFAATFFASLDFIAPGDTPRAIGDDERGYMNWAELARIDRHPLFEIEPHGVSHARVPISARIVDRLNEGNWRRLAWVQWAASPGPKHDWFAPALPAAVPIGSPVFESGLALATRAWRDGARESNDAMEQRIARDLVACRDMFVTRLGRSPEIFCWPENAVNAAGRRIAATTGYHATTGGRGRNVATEPVAIISRIHVGDRAIGFRWRAIESLHVRGIVRLAQGNHYWYLLIAPMNLARLLIMAIRCRWHEFA